MNLDEPSILKLLLLLCKPSINLLPHLAKLQLGPQHLVLFGFEGALGFLQGRLQLLLLALHPPPLFVELMDGPATIAKLVKQILDLVS